MATYLKFADGCVDELTEGSFNSGFIYVGYTGGSIYNSFLRYANIDINPSETIVSASLDLITGSLASGAFTLKVKGYKFPGTNPSGWADYSSRPRVASFGSLSVSGQNIDDPVSIDITGLIQDIINLGSWVYGDSIELYVERNDATSGEFISFYDNPNLVISLSDVSRSSFFLF